MWSISFHTVSIITFYLCGFYINVTGSAVVELVCVGTMVVGLRSVSGCQCTPDNRETPGDSYTRMSSHCHDSKVTGNTEMTGKPGSHRADKQSWTREVTGDPSHRADNEEPG